MADIINAVINLYEVLGLRDTIVLVILLYILTFISSIWKDHQVSKRYSDLKKHMELEIERLADDNRRYRDIYLARMGLSKEEITSLTAANITKREK